MKIEYLIVGNPMTLEYYSTYLLMIHGNLQILTDSTIYKLSMKILNSTLIFFQQT